MFTSRLTTNRFAPMVVLMAGTFMFVLDFFIVNVALPSIQGRLHAGAGATEWIVAGYGVALACSLITAGRLADAIGRRRVLMIGLAVFTAASAACGAAPDPSMLVAARVVQGMGGALIGPAVISIIGVLYEGEDRTRALSVYGMVMGLAAAGGQLIGGGLIGLNPLGLGWRTCFLINVPVGCAALLLARVLVPESRASVRERLDPIGTATVTAGLVALVLPLVEGHQEGWPAWTWCSLAGAPLLLGGLIAQQRRRVRRGRSPLLDPALLRQRAFAAGLGLQVVFWAGQASFFFVLALYLQEGRGLSALHAGLVFSILAAAYLAASLRAPALTVRHGRRLVLIGALALAAGHLALLLAVADIGTGGSIAELVPGLLLAGAGMGLCITPLTAISLAPLAPESAGAASGALSTVQQVGNALGVAVTGVIFFVARSHGLGPAFSLSEGELAGVLLAVALLSRLLPRGHDLPGHGAAEDGAVRSSHGRRHHLRPRRVRRAAAPVASASPAQPARALARLRGLGASPELHGDRALEAKP
ncbi:MAG TPA: MFS transporter [Solirubrobacteraceae bacterium]|nr:MFS transporter [Solirubrobacteraceae bacterium]